MSAELINRFSISIRFEFSASTELHNLTFETWHYCASTTTTEHLVLAIHRRMDAQTKTLWMGNIEHWMDEAFIVVRLIDNNCD
jgi:hypothetical protein